MSDDRPLQSLLPVRPADRLPLLRVEGRWWGVSAERVRLAIAELLSDHARLNVWDGEGLVWVGCLCFDKPGRVYPADARMTEGLWISHLADAITAAGWTPNAEDPA